MSEVGREGEESEEDEGKDQARLSKRAFWLAMWFESSAVGDEDLSSAHEMSSESESEA